MGVILTRQASVHILFNSLSSSTYCCFCFPSLLSSTLVSPDAVISVSTPYLFSYSRVTISSLLCSVMWFVGVFNPHKMLTPRSLRPVLLPFAAHETLMRAETHASDTVCYTLRYQAYCSWFCLLSGSASCIHSPTSSSVSLHILLPPPSGRS